MSDALSKDQSDAPVTYTHSKDQLLGRAQEFMRLQYGAARELDFDKRSQWHERLGLLVLFVEHITDRWNP